MADSVFDQLTEQQLRGRKTIKWNHFGPDVLPLWIAEMDFPTAPTVVDGIRACVANEEFGYPAFREDTLPRATADWCRRRYGWRVAPDWVRVVPDVLKGMEVVDQLPHQTRESGRAARSRIHAVFRPPSDHRAPAGGNPYAAR